MLADSAGSRLIATGGTVKVNPWGDYDPPPGCSVFIVWVTVTLSFFIVFSVLFVRFRYFPLSVTAVTLVSIRLTKEW